MDFASLIAGGNTLPGGFCRIDEDVPVQEQGRSFSPRGPASYEPAFGQAAAAKDSVLRYAACGPNTSPRSHRPIAPAPVGWQISESMMHQKWGTVLRSLDPSAANAYEPLPRAPTPAVMPSSLSPRLVPSFGVAQAQAYTHAKGGMRLAPAPGAQARYSSLSLRPTLPAHGRPLV